MNRSIISYSLLAFCCLSMHRVACQRVEYNKEGEKVVLYEDGGWRYYLPSDSIYLGGSKLENSSISTIDSIIPFVPVKSKLELVSDLSDEYVIMAQFEQERYANIQAKKYYLEGELNKAKSNKEFTGEEYINSIEDQLKLAKESEKKTKNRVKKANQKVKEAQQIMLAPYAEQYAWYDKEKGKSDGAIYQEPQQENEIITIADPIIKIYKDETSGIPKEVDLIYFPPIKACSAYTTIDEATGIKRKDTPLRPFFSYTHDQMLPHLKGATYIISNANITSTPGYTFLNIEIIIANEKAKSVIGTIAKGAPITFYFIEGESLTLNSRRFDSGRVDPLKKTTTYLIQMPIDKASEKLLKNKLLDQLRIVWSRGYEDYEITNVDFFEHQIECLRNGS